MRKLCIILCLLTFFSCKKDGIIRPYNFLSVKFIEEADYIPLEKIDANWNKDQKLLRLNALGYLGETFFLYLPNLTDTGYYPNPSIANISYSDGFDFKPYKLNNGFIHISYIDSITVSGDFTVSLVDDFNGSETRTIIGNFAIKTK